MGRYGVDGGASERRGGASLLLLVWMVLGQSAAVRAQEPAKAAGAADATSPPRSFDVVSIKPSGPDSPVMMQWRGPTGYRVQNMPLLTSVMVAYLPLRWFMTRNGNDRIVNAPDWLKKEPYDVVGTIAAADRKAWEKQGQDLSVTQEMLRAALRERCKLAVHRILQDGPAYGLVPGKHAPVLKPAEPNVPDPAGTVPLPSGGKMVPYQRGAAPTVMYVNISMMEFAAYLSHSGNRPVVDRTGLPGRYTFSLTLRDKGGEVEGDPEAASPWDLEKLGFKLVPMNVPLDTVVIDHIEKPTEN